MPAEQRRENVSAFKKGKRESRELQINCNFYEINTGEIPQQIINKRVSKYLENRENPTKDYIWIVDVIFFKFSNELKNILQDILINRPTEWWRAWQLHSYIDHTKIMWNVCLWVMPYQTGLRYWMGFPNVLHLCLIKCVLHFVFTILINDFNFKECSLQMT